MRFPLARVLRAGVGRDTTTPQDLDRLSGAVTALGRQLEAALQEAERLLQAERERAHERASLGGLPRPTLLSESISMEGRPLDRLRATRVRVGEPVERPYSRFVGITRCATQSADVRGLWARLLALEADCGDDVLRGLPCTVLDVPGATAASVDGTLRIVPRSDAPASGEVLAVPRCTYDAAARKVGNFGHWMLDYAPQVVALWKVAPDATILMPHASTWFHAATLAQMGFDVSRLRPWDGSPVECRRLLAFEHDGRTGGGRPLSPLMDVRRLLAPPETSGAPWTRRIYISRLDAPKKRRWIANERAVEELFRSRGFEIVVMRDCPFEEQIRLFREARVVAGLNGGGLTDIVFSRRGTDVIVLLSDWLMRWYAGGGRSAWSGGARGGAGRLAALGDSPRFWTHVAAAFEQRCHSFVGGDELPLGELASFLDEVLAGLDRA